MKRLLDKRIAVIGAGSVGEGWGNGKATAVCFARQGARVLCVDRDKTAAARTVAAIEDEGGIAVPFACDIVDPAGSEAILAEMKAHFSGIDVLHYNVGASVKGGVAETSDADWARVFEVNLNAAFRLTRTIIPAMQDGGGAITYVSTMAAVRSGPYSYVGYEVSKAALGRMMKSVARTYAKDGIRANAILPGLIDTPHVRQFIDAETDPETLAARRAALVPMGRQGTAFDVAHAAVFLASDEAGFISGVELKVDGAMSA